MLETNLSTTIAASLNSVKPLPVTRGLPLLGSLPYLLRRPFDFVQEARRQHGDIYFLDLGVTQAVVLNHPRHAQHVLRDNGANYRKGGPMWEMIRALLGNGLVVSEGDFWLRQRRMMQPHFHRRRLAALTDLMVTAIDEALDGWVETAVPNEPFNLAAGFNELTMRVIVRTLFGSGISPEEMQAVSEAMTFALDYMMSGMVINSLPGWLPVPGRKRFREAMAVYDEVIYKIIAQCRAGEGEDNHLLAMLLNTVDAETGEQMDDRQLRDEVATLFLAGYETTSIALSWAVELLTRHPDVAARLQQEVDQLLQGSRPTFADLKELGYTRMVLQEVMRLYPPAYWVPRMAVEDDEIDGYHIPAGANVVSLTYLYHRHPEVWDEPEKFDPDRFAPKRSDGRHPFAWIPFGAGQRLCIGRDFSIMEGQLALAMVFQRFNIDRAVEAVTQAQLSTTLRPKGGLMMHLAEKA